MATFAAVRVAATSAMREARNARAFDDRVRALAGDLFVALRTAHHLPTEYGEQLAAAVLQEIGSLVNRSGRHRHTHYLIANSELWGYATAQRRVIAVIARYVGKSRPAPGDRLLRELVAVGR
ncbi:MAG: hypothetical protein B6D46_09440 [Polyangiaceae bacterium UTPRO1]|jgi:exopolyphosphatase/guanosine-5'-triphosphate,3'-diphosphate pyrophosphatase|nr:hypothetical protein [Myxococcales bacterium]OQY66674.1 MAG: hypothetical protein B6D46_09440 [Polyangiaceae bacterium UTPRO1]